MNEKRISGGFSRLGERWAQWLWIAAILVATLAIGGLGEQGRVWLRFERSGLQRGELWRLLTGHLTHLGFGHIALNLVALALLRALFAGCLRPIEWFLAGLASVLAIDLGLYVLNPEIDWYVGLSGALHGVALAGGLALASRGMRLGLLLCGAIVLKLVFEQIAGPLPFSELSSGGTVVVDAHLYGAAGGGIGWWLSRLLSLSRARSV